MKPLPLAIALLISLFAAACAAQPARQVTPAPGDSTPAGTTNHNEEAEVRALVESFGKRLGLVSLLAPSAAQDLENQYSEFVSPALLAAWKSDVSKAPGRMVSSPWPDRIEITSLEQESPDKYAIEGYVIEITSTEINTDKAANKIPVHLVVEHQQDRWLISEYVQEH